MKELANVRQIPGELRRRWFSSDQFNLIVWYNDDETPAGFELCYDKNNNERSLIWSSCGSFSHMAVDSGESRAGKPKATPVLVPDGFFDAHRIHLAFELESESISSDVARLVLQAIRSHPNFSF